MDFNRLFEYPYKEQFVFSSLLDKHQKILLSRFPYWKIVISHHPFLMLECKFTNFDHVLIFINQIGVIAKQINHHPNVSFGWNFCNLVLYSHITKSLSWSDAYMVFMIDIIIQTNSASSTLTTTLCGLKKNEIQFK